MKRALAWMMCALVCLAALPLSAQNKDSSLTPVDGLDNWKYGLDLGSYAPGKYNLIVEGKDKAGNVTRAAPMNIFVDPKAGLPTISIINPSPFLRVGGDLNIVGTCVCSEKVDRVEVSIDKGEFVAANGGEFWSLYLKTADIEEGRRTLAVRGVDAKGRTGPVAQVQFDLDRTKPLVTVASPAIGSLVSGQIRLSGTVFDANGVRSLEISQDDGKTWASVPIKKGRDSVRPSFSWPIDTKKYKDGPKVFSLRTVAMVGSESSAAYLIFVDNGKPTIDIVRPATGTSVHGLFALAGAARDAVGLKRLSYEFGGVEKGDIPIIKGDPYFVEELDARKIKGDSATLTVVAEDPIGNTTRWTRTLKIDHKADRPVLKVLGPSLPTSAQAKSGAAAILREGDVVWGSISDPRGVSSFRWSLDGAAPKDVPCTETFSLSLPPAGAGRHSLSLVPVNIDGTAGDPVVLPLDIDRGAGLVVFDHITSVKASRDFGQGSEVAVDSGEFLEGSVTAPRPPSSASYSIADGKPRPIVLAKGTTNGTWRFRIPLDRSLPYGFAAITVEIKDVAGNEYGAKALLYVTDYGIAREEPGFRFSDSRVGADGLVKFGPAVAGAPSVSGAFYGGVLASIRFDPPTDLVTAGFEGRTVTLTAAKEGKSAPTRIIGRTDKGREFSAGPFVFATDSPPPTLNVTLPAEGSLYNVRVVLSGTVSASDSLSSLSWRTLPDGARSDIPIAKDLSFFVPVKAEDLPAGPVSIEIDAENAAGKVTKAFRNIGVYTAAPTVRFLSPEKGAQVQGSEDVAAIVDDPAGLSSVEYAEDGNTFAAIDWSGSCFAHRADLAAHPKAAYRITDRAGNKTVARPDVVAGTSGSPAGDAKSKAAPTIRVVYPGKGVVSMPGPFPLVLEIEGDNGVASANLAIGEGKQARVEDLDVASGGAYFARIVDPSLAPKGGSIPISISAKDSSGHPATLALKYGYDSSAATPKISIGSLIPESPGSVSGSATSPGGAPSIEASIDGGAPADFSAGSFALSLPELAAGKHTLAIVAKSPSGVVATVKKDFTVKGKATTLGDFKVVSGKKSAAWTPGGDYELGASSSIAGTLSAPNGVVSLVASFNGGTAVPASVSKAGGAAQVFSVAVPPALPYGRVAVELRAKDAGGLETDESIELHKVLASISGVDDDEGLRFADSRISTSDGKASFLLAPDEKLVGRFNGRPLRSAAIQPASASLAASFDGSLVTIEGKAQGYVAQASLVLTTVDGEDFRWGPFSASVGSENPLLDLDAPSDGDWTKAEVKVKGKVSDLQGIVALEASIDGAPPVALMTPSELTAKGDLAFDKVLSLASAPDGSTRIDIIAHNGAGRVTRVSRFINKDTVPPTLTQVLPLAGDSVNGMTTFVGEATDEGRIVTVEFVTSLKEKGDELSGLSTFSRDLDLARLALPLPEGCGFAATDKAGNRAVLAPTAVVDKEKDKPIAEIETPSDMEIFRGDFIISGVAYDDDGLAAVYYRIDGAEWKKIAMDGTSFSIPIALKDTTDNGHLVEVKAEDIYGVQGDVVSRKYRISTEEPKATMDEPSIAKPVRGIVKIAGTASDANGIKEVSVSIDNRTSYDKPVGTESWSLQVDTTMLSDGIHAVAVRPVDGYETEGFYASLISVDNTPPEAYLDQPRDGDEEAATLTVSGRVSDNIAVASSRIEVAPVGSSAPPAIVVDLGTEKIVQRSIDVSGLSDGVYTVRLIVLDRAGNEGLASRNVRIAGRVPLDSLSIFFPVQGERVSGKLRVQGRLVATTGAGTVSIMVDGNVIGTAQPDELGWYSFTPSELSLADGDHALKATASLGDGRTIQSGDTKIEWETLGRWVSIDSIPVGKYLQDRPFLRGKAGWEAEPAPTGDAKALETYRKAAASRRVASVDVSLDDGRSFVPAKGKESWSFRLETDDFKEGALHVIVRARYADGTTASARSVYFLDKTPPEVHVLWPTEGGRYNGLLQLEGTAHDQNGMASVGMALRKGDKANYEVPSFVQGLFVDGQMLGATTWQSGIGLSFFGDNVKLEAVYGQAPDIDATTGLPESFFGDVFGGKLIANVFYLPAKSILGPDWSFLSASLGLGAGFQYFTETQSGSGLVVGSVFAQLEFPKITFSQMSVFKKISFYTEYEAWILSSIVQGGYIQKMSFGARVGVF